MQLFVFSKLTSTAYLEEPRLPARASEWFNDLKQECPSQEDVDEANAEFDRHGFSSTGEYLRYYLKQDLIITGRASVKYLNMFAEMFHVHPADSLEMTISSFSFGTTQRHLFREKRVACFSPNQARRPSPPSLHPSLFPFSCSLLSTRPQSHLA